MINPSANGWINKYFVRQNQSAEFTSGRRAFYLDLRRSGFIFGHIVSIESLPADETKGWLTDEVSKVGLLSALYAMHKLTTGTNDQPKFVADAIAFYRQMKPVGTGIFSKVFTSSPATVLEEIIDQRVQTNHDVVTKNFSHIVTNALLFIDVLAFSKFLEQKSIPEKYLKRIEETVISIISLALKTKTVKSQHDKLLIKLFEASVRYSKFSKVSVENLEALKLDSFSDLLEHYYFIDLAGMSLWSDGVVENEEAYFLHRLGEILELDDNEVRQSIESTNYFINTHKKEIPYFNYSNPVKHFYDHLTQSVITLLTRNRKRLVKEISQSKELMILLAHSTHRDLDAREKKRIKSQLLDICKTIPSLTIFLLPGGSLLLPILIKFIPTMLPSAFNENHDLE